MKKSEIFKQFRIDIIGSTVFIKSKVCDFSYTPVNDIVKEEYRERYRYFGGLQCDFPVDSEEYILMEKWLCEMAETVLKQIGAMK